jgi:hypothetical protein
MSKISLIGVPYRATDFRGLHLPSLVHNFWKAATWILSNTKKPPPSAYKALSVWLQVYTEIWTGVYLRSKREVTTAQYYETQTLGKLHISTACSTRVLLTSADIIPPWEGGLVLQSGTENNYIAACCKIVTQARSQEPVTLPSRKPSK